MPISDKIKQSISGSSFIRKMFEEGIQLKKKYGEENVFDFSIGNPDVEPPREFFETMKRFSAESVKGIHGYMPNAGFVDVRERIAIKVKREHHVEITSANIVMTVGAAGGLNVIMKTLLNPDDEVIVPKPYFVEYGSYIANYSGKMVLVSTKSDFSLDLDAIAAALNDKSRILLLNSPHNPTGRIYSEDEIKSVAEILRDHKAKSGRTVYIVADEPYREIVYDGKVVPGILNNYENSLVVTSYSKSLSLPGERIGYIAVSPTAEDASDIMAGIILCNRILGFVNAPAVMQRVVAELIDVSVDTEIYKRRRDIFVKGLKEAGIDFANPEGAFYIFCKAPIEDDVEFVNHLKSFNILAVPGSGFGAPGYFRLAYCVSEKVIERSIPKFKEAMNKYSK